MDQLLEPRERRLNRRMFLKLCLPLVLAACAAPKGAPTEAPATELLVEPPSPVPPTATGPAALATEAASTVSVPVPTQQPATAAPPLPPTPACGDADDPTPPQTEGPFFTPNSPERTSLLEPGLAGAPMTLTGYVLGTDCRPVAGALVDFWHADEAGAYDNVGYRFRGHQFTDAEGRYTLETIVPGLYPGRTRHFHVKVQAANQPVLTTQLYFPEEPGNASDGIFSPDLVMTAPTAGSGAGFQFNFVLNAA